MFFSGRIVFGAHSVETYANVWMKTSGYSFAISRATSLKHVSVSAASLPSRFVISLHAGQKQMKPELSFCEMS